MPTGPSASAGRLRERVRFERRMLDEYGQHQGGWSPFYECAARIQALRGGETVIAQRLEGSQPVIVTVRACPPVRALTSADRLVNLANGQAYDIKDVSPDERRIWTDVLAVAHAGGTVG